MSNQLTAAEAAVEQPTKRTMNKATIGATLALLCITSACTNVRPVGKINGLDVTRITTRGVFSPSTTSIVISDPAQPGTIEGTIANAAGQGFLPAVANAAGVAGAAALIRPDRSKTTVNQSGGGANASATGGDAAATAVSKSRSSSISNSTSDSNSDGGGTVNGGNHNHNH